MTDGPLIIGFDQLLPPKAVSAWRMGPDGMDMPHPIGPGEAWPVPGVWARDFHGARVPVEILGEGTHDDALTWTRGVLRRHVWRVVPWAVLWLAPRWRSGADHQLGGEACTEAGVALLRSSSSPDFMLWAAWHELWHLLEDHLPPDVLATLDTALRRGPDYPRQALPWQGEGRRGEYLGLREERRARFFAHYACAAVENGRGAGSSAALSGAWSIAARAWSGELGALAAERRERAARIGAEGPDPARQGREG